MQKTVTNPIKKSIMMSEQDMEDINDGDESDHDLISTDILEEICNGSQTCLMRV